jgi:hypothetical protein
MLNAPQRGHPIMRRKNIIGLVLITVAVAVTLMVFASSSPVTDSACKEGLDEPGKKINSGKMIWENLSHQFFSTL